MLVGLEKNKKLSNGVVFILGHDIARGTGLFAYCMELRNSLECNQVLENFTRHSDFSLGVRGEEGPMHSYAIIKEELRRKQVHNSAKWSGKLGVDCFHIGRLDWFS